MEGKFNNWHKCLEVACFVLILTSSIYKGLYCDGDMGVVIILSFKKCARKSEKSFEKRRILAA